MLCARLRQADQVGAAGSVEELTRIEDHIRTRWPTTEIVIRGDSGFCRDSIMCWCEERDNVHYVLGLAQNKRLNGALGEAMNEAKQRHEQQRQAVRVFDEFNYQARKSWTRSRRVIGKAEHLDKGANPRFVVTSLPQTEVDARTLYERLYCARGDMENRIKEQQLCLFADRTSTSTMRANQRVSAPATMPRHHNQTSFVPGART